MATRALFDTQRISKTRQGISMIKAPEGQDPQSAQKVFELVDIIISNHTFCDGNGVTRRYDSLIDYLSSYILPGEIKYIKGILAENGAVAENQKTDFLSELVERAVSGVGISIEKLDQAISAVKTPQERKALEAKLEQYLKENNIEKQYPGQSALQAVLYANVKNNVIFDRKPDHALIRKYNEMLISQGAYSEDEIVNIRAEQAILQILEGDYDNAVDAIKNINDRKVLNKINEHLRNGIYKNKKIDNLRALFIGVFKFKTVECDLLLAELGSKNLLGNPAKNADKIAEVAVRLIKNSDFNNRAAGLKMITTQDIAKQVDNKLQANGSSLQQVLTEFNKDKAKNISKAKLWDGLAMWAGTSRIIGNRFEKISDDYRKNTELSDNMYVETDNPIELDETTKYKYNTTVQLFEQYLVNMKEDYQRALDSQGIVSDSVNNFCQRYNIGTTRDEIEARITYDTETLRLLKLAVEGKLTKISNGEALSVSFEKVFQERQSASIRANGFMRTRNNNEVNFDAGKIQTLNTQVERTGTTLIMKDSITNCWNELDSTRNSNDQGRYATAIYNTLTALSKITGCELSLSEYGYKFQDGIIVDSHGTPVQINELKKVVEQLLQGLCDMAKSSLNVDITTNTNYKDAQKALQKGYDKKLEEFKQEYKKAFGQDAPDDLIENYVKTINYGKMGVNIVAVLGAAILAPLTGGGSLAMFAMVAGTSFTLNALEHGTDANGFTMLEFASDAEQALWDGALAAVGMKVGQFAETFAKSGKILAINRQWLGSIIKNSETLKKVTAWIARLEALNIELSSDSVQSLIQMYCMEGEFNEEAFVSGLFMSIVGNTVGHVSGALSDTKALNQKSKLGLGIGDEHRVIDNATGKDIHTTRPKIEKATDNTKLPNFDELTELPAEYKGKEVKIENTDGQVYNTTRKAVDGKVVQEIMTNKETGDISIKTFYPDGSAIITDKIQNFIRTTHYNSKSQLAGIKDINTETGEISVSKYSYDEKGNKIITYKTQNHTRIEYYNSKSQLTSSTQINAETGETSVSKYSYDERGNRIKYEREVNGEKEYVEESKYNANNHIAERVTTWSDGTKSTLKFDENGELVERIDTSPNKSKHIERYKNTHDNEMQIHEHEKIMDIYTDPEQGVNIYGLTSEGAKIYFDELKTQIEGIKDKNIREFLLGELNKIDLNNFEKADFDNLANAIFFYDNDIIYKLGAIADPEFKASLEKELKNMAADKTTPSYDKIIHLGELIDIYNEIDGNSVRLHGLYSHKLHSFVCKSLVEKILPKETSKGAKKEFIKVLRHIFKDDSDITSAKQFKEKLNSVNLKAEIKKIKKEIQQSGKNLTPAEQERLKNLDEILDDLNIRSNRKFKKSLAEYADETLRKDFQEDLKIGSLVDYCKNYPTSETATKLYSKYLESLDISPELKQRLSDINTKYNTKIFLSKDNISEQTMKFIEAELAKWNRASGGQAKYPPTLDLLTAKQDYFDNTAAYGKSVASGFSEHGSNAISVDGNNTGNLEWALRHEMTHSNDMTRQGLEAANFDEIKANKKYKTELKKANPSRKSVDYAYNNAAEFIAVASEGDVSMYSDELKEVLISLGMPKWALDMRPNPYRYASKSAKAVIPEDVSFALPENIAADAPSGHAPAKATDKKPMGLVGEERVPTRQVAEVEASEAAVTTETKAAGNETVPKSDPSGNVPKQTTPKSSSQIKIPEGGIEIGDGVKIMPGNTAKTTAGDKQFKYPIQLKNKDEVVTVTIESSQKLTKTEIKNIINNYRYHNSNGIPISHPKLAAIVKDVNVKGQVQILHDIDDLIMYFDESSGTRQRAEELLDEIVSTKDYKRLAELELFLSSCSEMTGNSVRIRNYDRTPSSVYALAYEARNKVGMKLEAWEKTNPTGYSKVDKDMMLRYESAFKFMKQYPDSPLADDLYEKYLLLYKKHPDIVNRLSEISKNYGVKIMLPAGAKINNFKTCTDYIETELKAWKEASGGKAKMPPVIQFNSAKSPFYFGAGPAKVAAAYSEPLDNGALAFPEMDVKEVKRHLRHEITHTNDTKHGVNIDERYALDEFLADPKKQLNLDEIKQLRYYDELKNAGIPPHRIKYAHSNTRELIAVATEGDMSKYSPEFKKILIDYGMPEWMFDIKPHPQSNAGTSGSTTASNNVKQALSGETATGRLSDNAPAQSAARKPQMGLMDERQAPTRHAAEVEASEAIEPRGTWDESIQRPSQKKRIVIGEDTSKTSSKLLDKRKQVVVFEISPNFNLRNIAHSGIADGSVFSQNGKLYIRNGKEAVALDISPETYESLFPHESLNFQQSYTNTCWFLSTLENAFESPQGKTNILKMFSEDSNGNLSITFDGCRPIEFRRGKPISLYVGVNSATSDPGVKLLEQALGIHLAHLDSSLSTFEPLRARRLSSKDIDKVNVELGKMRNPDDAKKLLGATNPNTFKNIKSDVSPNEFMDLIRTYGNSPVRKLQVIYDSHVHAIKGYEIIDGKEYVYISDPYSANQYPKRIPLEELMHKNGYITYSDYGKVPTEKAPDIPLKNESVPTQKQYTPSGLQVPDGCKIVGYKTENGQQKAIIVDEFGNKKIEKNGNWALLI